MTDNSAKIPADLTLTSPRLILRMPLEKDEEAIREIISHPRTMKYLRFMSHEPDGWTIPEVRERLRNQIEEQSRSVRATFHLLERSQPIEPETDPADTDGLKVLKVFENLEDTRDNQNLIGFGGLNFVNYKDMETCMGIILHYPFQGKGYATEVLYLTLWYAFEVLHMHRMLVQTTEPNEGMRGWMEKLCGVSVESVRRECIRLNESTWVNSWDYSILENEWRDLVKPRIEKKLGWKASA
ncbi:acyl-CoA N-acyltransferase [Basidiobolus meristosporus CBS 931.73]|uniref:Acyl-CoA N-acyltransferase n=1 Tax=Basidiobolus meristosporus CBS 931.73 TaxID=1314790 RepID=A0A1Y1YDE0_9FUNG|nr:acyl-CoA N-acyltransferase [Basidiobolus meristosporus CBS 931.73]|eukprot:ORX95644.1 acyl-CoA N-acyltransferase [Basidiobolus meristosporus CBS 931.73]